MLAFDYCLLHESIVLPQAGYGRSSGEARELRGGARGHSAQPQLAPHLAALRAGAPGGAHEARHRASAGHALRPGVQHCLPALEPCRVCCSGQRKGTMWVFAGILAYAADLALVI